MAKTASTMLPLGTPLPSFTLPQVQAEAPDGLGPPLGAQHFVGAPLVVMFICNHCPFVRHLRANLANFGRHYADRLGIVAISSNDPVAYPDDAPLKMATERAQAGYPFPYLFDALQEVARAFGAACTPDFYLFAADHRLVYRGQYDGSRPGNQVPVTGNDLRAACDAVLCGRPVASEQRPSLGCGIKWRTGQVPAEGK